MRTPLEVLYNFHWVQEGTLARSAQGFLGGLHFILKRRGIRGLVNVRGAHPNYRWWRAEVRHTGRLGIVRFDAKLDSRQLPTRDMLVALVDAFEKAPRPVLVKCSGGQDRTSFAASIFILMNGGWGAMGEAMKQFSRFPYLHFPKTQQRWLEQFPRYAQEKAKGAPIAAWIREAYDPADLAAWLSAKGLGDGFWRIYQPRA
jgi:hypothetical protein